MGSRDGAIARVLRYLDDGVFASELAERVNCRTESQRPENIDQLHFYLDQIMIPAFDSMGFECEKFENPMQNAAPLLLASRMEKPSCKTVLGYGHGDVVFGQEEHWRKGKGPWEIDRDDDRLYGRGTADNKAQHTINMAAIRAVLEERGALGFNARFLIEMGEEIGSPGLRELIEGHKEKFNADVFIGSDGPRMSPDKPTITLGARGALNFDLELVLREGSHHSGNWGGLIADPAIILSHALASIVSSSGQIKIKAWLPPPLSDSVKNALHGLRIDGGDGAPQIDSDWGEPGLTPAAKVYGWNSFAVLAMKSGSPENPVNAISPSAKASCQLRFVEGTEASRILPALREHLDEHGFRDVQIATPKGVTGFSASRTDPQHPWVRRVADSIQTTINATPAIIPSMGGSICNDVFTDILQLPAIWIPHSYAACSQHAPDEHIRLSVTRSALPIMAGLYWDLGEDV